MSETMADVLEPVTATRSSEDGPSITPEIFLDDLERCYREKHFIFHTERVMHYYQARDFNKVHELSLDLLRDEELPILYRARCNFLLAGVYQIDGQPLMAKEILDECIYCCRHMVAMDVENKRQSPMTVTHLLLFANIALGQTKPAQSCVTDNTASEAEYNESNDAKEEEEAESGDVN